ncbi:MAG: DUF2061 domain-containing protein [Pseudomonadota bacterium]
METRTRLMMRATTWQLLGLVVMTGISYPQVGSFYAALTIAASGAASGFLFYAVHEHLWMRVRWGRLQSPSDHAGTGTGEVGSKPD